MTRFTDFQRFENDREIRVLDAESNAVGCSLAVGDFFGNQPLSARTKLFETPKPSVTIMERILSLYDLDKLVPRKSISLLR